MLCKLLYVTATVQNLYKAPAKRSQNANQTSLGATCCVRLATMLRCVGCCWLKAPAKRSQHVNATYRNIVGFKMLRAFCYRVAMCCDMLGVVGSGLKMVKFEPTTPNTSQHVATGWPNARNMLRPTMLRYVALACCDRLAGA